MTVLDEILARKREDLARWKTTDPAGGAPRRPGPRPDFIAALRACPVGLIAEVKRRSPSAGNIREPFDPAAIARAYRAGGAAAISVLMDEPFFGGGAADFRAVRGAVDLPLLYKEFVLDPWQVAQADALGASAVLLIVAALSPDALRGLMAEVAGRGMTTLVEVHDAEELDRALDANAVCIGVNNRDLRTFKTSLDTTIRLLPRIPRDRLAVSESGIRTAGDLRRIREAGAAGALVGEHLLRCPDLESAVRELLA